MQPSQWQATIKNLSKTPVKQTPFGTHNEHLERPTGHSEGQHGPGPHLSTAESSTASALRSLWLSLGTAAWKEAHACTGRQSEALWCSEDWEPKSGRGGVEALRCWQRKFWGCTGQYLQTTLKSSDRRTQCGWQSALLGGKPGYPERLVVWARRKHLCLLLKTWNQDIKRRVCKWGHLEQPRSFQSGIWVGINNPLFLGLGSGHYLFIFVKMLV